MRRVAASLVTVLVLAILLFTLSPSGSLTSGSRLIDAIADIRGTAEQASWLLHAALFALLGAALSLWFASTDTARGAPRRTLLAMLLAVWLFAAADELAQGFVEGREASLGDWIADMAGFLAGFLLAPSLLRPVLRYWLH